MRERDFHSFEKGFKYQLCLRNAVEIAVVLLLIQSMKYAARLVSRENEVIREFHSVSIATICLRNDTTKRGKMMRQDDDIKHHDMHSRIRIQS